MKFNFPFRFHSWLSGEDLNSFLKRYFGSSKFENMKIIYIRDIKLEHCTIKVYHLFIDNKGYDDPLDTLYTVTDEEYYRVMEAIE